MRSCLCANYGEHGVTCEDATLLFLEAFDDSHEESTFAVDCGKVHLAEFVENLQQPRV